MSSAMDLCKDNGCSNKNDSYTAIPPSSIELPIPDEQLDELVSDAIDYALLHGAGMRYRHNWSKENLSVAPFFLLPTPFPRRDFEKVSKMQPVINKLMHKVAHDHEFLEKSLKNTIKVDEFTKNLWNIYTTVREEGVKQPVSLGLIRCDVMLDMPICTNDEVDSGQCSPEDGRLLTSFSAPEASPLNGCQCTVFNGIKVPCILCCSKPKQVEVNMIASSFAALTQVVQQIQKYVLQQLGRPDLIAKMPPNLALQELCSGMLAAYDHYNSKGSIILFVVEDVSYNICDQRFHEYEIIRQRPDVRVLRRSFTQLHNSARLDEQGKYWVKDMEVAVVYFRAGYDPSCYKGADEWQTRLNIERSMAIKCPTIHYHLAGTKKIQQELATKGILERFLSAEEALDVSQLFAGLYTLDVGEDGDKAVLMALAEPDRYVLKPQREGGGNNLYGEDIKKALEEIGSTHEREAYILMDRIRAPVQKNYLVRPEKPVTLTSVISELGIFGALLGSEEEIYLNKLCGFTLRSKVASNYEGGVSSGNGALDSVLLVD